MIRVWIGLLQQMQHDYFFFVFLKQYQLRMKLVSMKTGKVQSSGYVDSSVC